MRVKLGDIFEIGSGGTPSKLHPEYYGGNIPWVKTGDLKSEYLYKVEDYITEEGLINSSAKLYETDTVLVAMYGATIGAASILKMPACTNQACAAFRKSERVIPEYLYYFLKSQKNKFIKDGVGGAQPNISAGYLKRVQMELLSIDEQKATVDVLDNAANIIRKRKQEMQLLDDLIKARFVELTNKEKTVPTRMGDVATYVNGYAFKPTDWKNKGLPIIRIQNLNDSNALYNYFDGKINEKYRIHKGDVLVSWATHLEAYIWKGQDAWLNQHIFKVEFNKMEINKVYFVYSTEEALRQAFKNAHGFKPTMEHIKRSDFENAVIQVPSIELQNQFADFVNQVNKSKL